MRFAMLKTAAALAVAVAIPTAGHAAQDSASAYQADLSCAAYHLEIAGFYKSDLGKEEPRSEQRYDQFKQSGTAKLESAMEHANAIGKDIDTVKGELLTLIERRVLGNLEQGSAARVILAHVKDTTIKAETCQRSDNG